MDKMPLKCVIANFVLSLEVKFFNHYYNLEYIKVFYQKLSVCVYKNNSFS